MEKNIYRRARITASRKRRRFTDATLAAYSLGLSPSTLYKVERGEIEPTPLDVVNMCNVYGSEDLLDAHCSHCPVRVANLSLLGKKSSKKKDNLALGNAND